MKGTGFFTKAASKAIKADRMICREADGYNYVSNGYLIFKMTMEEYDAFIRPVAKCDPGNWWIDKNGKRELRKEEMDLSKLLKDAVAAAQGLKAANIAPYVFKLDSRTNATGIYSYETDTTAFFNSVYLDSFIPEANCYITGSTKPAVFTVNNEAVGMVLPIRPSEKMIRSVKAYFTDEAQDEKPNKKDETMKSMKEAIENLAADNTRLAKELEQYKAKVQELIAQQNAQPEETQPEADQEPEVEQPSAENPLDKFSNLPGTIATMKGEKTAHPVIWITGDTKPHAKTLKELGAKWSHKKTAWYYKVA